VEIEQRLAVCKNMNICVLFFKCWLLIQLNQRYVLRRNRELKNVTSSRLHVSGKEGNMQGAVSGVAEGRQVFQSFTRLNML